MKRQIWRKKTNKTEDQGFYRNLVIEQGKEDLYNYSVYKTFSYIVEKNFKIIPKTDPEINVKKIVDRENLYESFCLQFLVIFIL